jgi:hypothetical protein
MKLIITTQIYENYGAHTWDPADGACPQYWKAKGGNDYRYDLGTQSRSTEALKEIIEYFRPRLEQDDDYYRETILFYSVVEDSYLTEFEQSQLDYEGSIRYPATPITMAEECEIG